MVVVNEYKSRLEDNLVKMMCQQNHPLKISTAKPNTVQKVKCSRATALNINVVSCHWMMHINDPLLLIRKINSCSDVSRFLLSPSE